jgi:hypothetical protein
LIKQFWVINRGGVCLFNRSNKEESTQQKCVESDSMLVSGMLSAIMSFVSEVTKSDVKKFENFDSKYLFFAENQLIFIVEAKINVPDKKIKKRIKLINDLFIKKYQKQIDEFNGDVGQFKGFKQDLDELFQKMTLTEEWGNELEGLKI